MGLDFYGIEMVASIKVPQKIAGNLTVVEYPLWMGSNTPNITGGLNLPVALQDLSYVQDITIQIGLALNSKISVTLNMPLEEGKEFIHSPLLSWAGSELVVQIGYSTGDGRLSQPFGGLMMKPDVRIGTDVAVTLNALGVAYGMNLANATSAGYFPAGTTPWRAVKKTLQQHTRVNIGTDAQVFPDYADSPDKITENGPTAIPFFKPIIGKKASSPDDKASAETLKAAIDAKVAAGKLTSQQGTDQKKLIDDNIRTDDEKLAISKGPKNDWWFCRELCKDFGLDLIIRDNTLTIRDPAVWKLSKPKYKFVLKGNIDTEQGIYPILEFNTPSAYVWLGQGIGGAFLADVSTDNKKALTQLVTAAKSPANQRSDVTKDPPEDPPSITSAGAFLTNAVNLALKVQQVSPGISRTGKGVYIPTDSQSHGGGDAYSVFPGSPEDARAEQAVNELRNYNNNRGIQAEVTSVGIPEIVPADVMTLDGLAPDGTPTEQAWFDGLYGVMMVEHNIGTGGMTTKLKGVKNFFPGEMLGGASDPANTGPVNPGIVNKTGQPNLNAPALKPPNILTKIPGGD